MPETDCIIQCGGCGRWITVFLKANKPITAQDYEHAIADALGKPVSLDGRRKTK
jgi:hypothetical protein